MHVCDIIRIAMHNILKSSVRTWLTALSIAIGVASVTLIVSLSGSGKATLGRELDKLGISGITVYSNNASANPLTLDDAESIEKSVREIERTLPLVIEYGTYRMKNNSENAVIWGIGENAEEVMDFEILYGRMPSKTDVRFSRDVAVVDRETAEAVYMRENIIGKNIIINLGKQSRQFEIIGVISSQKAGINRMTGGIIPDFVYIPYTTANSMRASEDIHQIAVKFTAESSADAAGEKAVAVLNRTNNTQNGYAAENLTGHVNNLKNIADIVALLLSLIAGISLCVSGLGIMNTMLSSAGERKREIGICMAIGAKRKDITMCFLAESALIAAIGGCIGGVVGFGLSAAAACAFNMPFVFSVKNFILIEAVSILCGILFAVIPANCASKLDPITALRDE